MYVYVVMGVSGCGKSTVGKLLANSLNIPFYDGDDFHPDENIERMKSGRALDCMDHRIPWLVVLNKNIFKRGAEFEFSKTLLNSAHPTSSKSSPKN